MSAAAKISVPSSPERSIGFRTGLAVASVVFPCAVSGAAGLAYEVAWTHELSLAAGNSSRSLALVLATFLGGMALGGWLAGRRAVSGYRPLVLLCGLELLLAAFGLLWPSLLGALPELVSGLVLAGAPVAPVRLLAVACVLLPPALAMGATFPLWVRGVRDLGVSRRRSVALVSCTQLFGAAAGAFLAGFLIVPAWGFAAASHCAGLADAAVFGVLLLRLPGPAVVRSAAIPIVEPGKGRYAWAFVICGVASVGYQVVWTRALVFFFDGFHFALSAVLVACLVGLGLGAAAVALLVRRVARPERWLSVTQVLAAVGGLATLLVLPQLGPSAVDAARDPGGYSLRVLLLAGALLVLPGVALGTTLPLATWISDRRTGGLASAVAGAYGRVTAGNAVGALLVTLVAVPLLSLRTTWASLAVLNAIGALLLAGGRVRWLAAASMVLAGSAVVWTLIVPNPLILSSHVFLSRLGRDRELVSSQDGESCSVAVVRDLGRGGVVLYTDAFAAAATGRAYPYMRLLGHLPALLCADPQRALVVCFGTGTTAGAVSLHGEVRTLRLVDVEERVFEVADAFRTVNHDVLAGREGLHVQRVVEDGRFDLLLSREPYDLITLEPLMPYTLGAAPFYTREFYDLARSRLAEGGVLCQWVPVHALPVADYRALLRTFLDVFPDGDLFFFEQSSLLVGRVPGPRPSLGSVSERARRSAIAQDLRTALVDGVNDLLGARVAGGAALRGLTKDDPVMEDDRPFVAFRTVRPEADPRRPLKETLEFLVRAADEEAALDREQDDPIGLHHLVSGISDLEEVALEEARDVRVSLLRARHTEAAIWLRAADTGKGVSLRPALAALGEPLGAAPGHLEARRLFQRLSFRLDRLGARVKLEEGDPVAAFHLLEGHRGFAEWDRDAEALQAAAFLCAGAGEEARDVSQKLLLGHPRHVLALVVRSLAAALLSERDGGKSAGTRADAIDPERARSARAFVRRIRTAALRSGHAPLTLVTQRLRSCCRPGVLDDPGMVQDARDGLGISADDPLLSLLQSGCLRRLAGDDPSETLALEGAREVAVLGLSDAWQRLVALGGTATEESQRQVYRRALAALVPGEESLVAELVRDPDVVVRRLVTSFAAARGSRAVLSALLPGLEDSDEDVRLYTDRALRRITGESRGYDYLAPAEERAAAAARWRELVEK